jgi:hypothetical protein
MDYSLLVGVHRPGGAGVVTMSRVKSSSSVQSKAESGTLHVGDDDDSSVSGLIDTGSYVHHVSAPNLRTPPFGATGRPKHTGLDRGTHERSVSGGQEVPLLPLCLRV